MMRIEVQPSITVEVKVQAEDSRWIGVVERPEANGVATARVEFDHEPTEAEVRDYVTQHYESLKFVTAAQAASLKGQEALKRLLEQKQHKNAIASRLNQQGGKGKLSGAPVTRGKDRHRGVR